MWSKGSVSITVQFTDSKTVSKNITGFKFSRQPKLDINAYNTISDGSSYNDVVAKYGEPDMRQIWRKTPGEYLWRYNRMGLELVMRYDRVDRIRILKNGNRRFDRTGFNCANAPYEFQEVYGVRYAPGAGPFGSFEIGHGECMWFDEYPDCIELSTCCN